MINNIEEANFALAEKPLLATSAERFLILDELKSSYKELPQPLRFSKILAILLSRVSVPVMEHDIIAGRCIDRLLTDKEEARFQDYLKHPDYPSRQLFLGSGHCTYSWESVVKEGICGLRKIVSEQLNKPISDKKRIFLFALSEIYDAISSFMLRYAVAAEEKGLYETASNLRRAATEKPDSFATALQLLWIITLIDCAYITENPTLTVGRLDKILYPLYQKDIERGLLTKERAKEYITDYYCKHNLIMGRGEHQVGDSTNSTTFRRILNFDAPQYLLLAGTDESGKAIANELTELFAECIVPSFKNPVILVRYVKNMDKNAPHLWKTLCDKALSSASLMFYNDDNVISTLKRIGLPDSDARRYEHFGCNWCSAGDNSAWMMNPPKSRNYDAKRSPDDAKTVDIPYMRTRSEHSWPEDFMEILRTLANRSEDTVSIDDFYELFFERMGDFIDRKLKVNSLELSLRQESPSSAITFGDCFLIDSVKNGECFSANAKYHFDLFAFQMFGTVADCFIAVDQLVMIKKKISLSKLLEATEANFVGYPEVLALCRGADKYGMDTPLSNKHTHRLSHTASELLIEKCKPYFEKQRLFLTPSIQSDMWHLKYGETFGATPDGRLAYTPYSQNSRPSLGACSGGLTAMFNSMLNLPRDGFVSGALNLDINPKDFESEAEKQTFACILATYLNSGGLHAQVSSLNIDELIDAKRNPHSHRDLRVRVTGYSGIFVDFCEKLQNDVINRFKK